MTEASEGFDHKAFLKTLPASPGVYQMYDVTDKLLYIGKAKNLKNRVSSYFRSSGLTDRMVSLVQQIARIDVTITHTETEALLLESNLIKRYRPRYNIILRDDKSYPYIRLTSDQDYPGLFFHRGKHSKKDRYFGPYPSASAVRETLALLQKTIPVRQCEESYFRNRSRPCLQHQIKRCTAPCVDLISKQDYADDVEQVVLFLDGKSDALIETLADEMEQSSAALAFEKAAVLRDRIARVRRIQERQYVSGAKGDIDVIVLVHEGLTVAVGVMFIRSGRSLGTKVLFPAFKLDLSDEDMLMSFIAQYYQNKPPAREILLATPLPDKTVLEEALSERADFKIRISIGQRGERRRWLESVRINASDVLRRRIASRSDHQQRLKDLKKALKLETVPERMECIDISHTQGEATVASLVVFGADGPLGDDYRRYNIEDITPGDDYAAIRQALSRRYQRVLEEGGRLPDVLFIDGGKGQLAVAVDVINELAIHGITLLGVAKGRERKAGWERLFQPGSDRPLILKPDAPALLLIQQIRDEAHRFAITGHRRRRAKARVTSTLEEIPGIGEKKRQALLRHLGGLQGVARAGIDDLSSVPGISQQLAARVHACFHE
ncbi:MAG TPA: excinuclease ABC subunit C [Gammaproteobacteria bacterium]|nr:excinuclease ABC subunit C [Gammaproteobacteria bacterium]